MASTGRKLDPVWADFDRIAPNRRDIVNALRKLPHWSIV